MTTVISRSLCALCVLTLSLPLVAQVATGSYPLGTFDNLGADAINVGNLNLMLDIPVLHKFGRAGTNFTYDLAYNGSIWTPPVSGSGTWVPDQNWGWISQTQALTGYISEAQIRTTCSYGRAPGTTIANVIYHDSAGVFHRFSGHVQTGPCPGNTNTLAGTWSEDHQYYINSTNQLTNLRGATIIPPVTVQDGPAIYTDTNGNEISTDGNGNFTDTTGVIVLAVNGTAPANQVYTYTDANGITQNLTVSYNQYTVTTNFGCSGISEYSQTSVPLVNSVLLADGSSYTFQYEHAPGAASGSVTGRLASILLPTGGTISYSYSGENNGINCADGSTIALTRTQSSTSGTPSRIYTRTPSGSLSHTSVLDELGNDTEYDFVQGAGTQNAVTEFYETAQTAYQGTGGAALLARQVCYNQASQPCNDQIPTMPITQIDTYQIWDGVSENGTTTALNTSGQTTSVETYDFGSSARGSVLQTETWGYSNGYLQFHFLADGSGENFSRTAYTYGPGVVTTSGVPQHTTAYGSSGNLTEIDRYPNTADNKNYYPQTFQYYDTGSLQISSNIYGAGGSSNGTSDPTPGSTVYSYDSTNTYPVTSAAIVTNSLSLSSGATYDLTSGVLTSSSSLNGTVSTGSMFDAFGRPQQISVTSGSTVVGKSTVIYQPNRITANLYQSPSVSTESDTFYDLYGHLIRTATQRSSSPTSFYIVDTCYDGGGRVNFQSYPYVASLVTGTAVCSGPGDTYASYDALGRVKQIVHGDAARTSLSYKYLGAASSVTDENGVGHIYQYDGLNRISIACELSSNASMPNSGAPTSCGTLITGSGFLTTYSYQASITSVTQGNQMRSFFYDGLGRLSAKTESEATPATGGSATTFYTYPAGTSSGGFTVTRRTPRAGQTSGNVTTTTTYQYDVLDRLTSVSYNDGVTPSKTYTYDQVPAGSPINSGASSGQLTSAATNASTTFYGYDAMGRKNSMAQCLPGSCGATPTWIMRGSSFDWQGNQTSENYSVPGGSASLGYGVNLAGQLQSVTGGQDASVAASLYSVLPSSMTPSGPSGESYGNGIASTLNYDVFGHPSGLGLTLNNNPLYAWTASWSGNRVSSSADSVNGGTSNYSYDDMNRLSGASVGSLNLAWTYDRYGNRWSQSATGTWPGSVSQPSLSFSSSSNQITTAGYQYDIAGNLIQDPSHSYSYDAEGNLILIDNGATASYTYDALNQRVQTVTPGGTQEFGFNVSGQRATVWDGSGNLVSAQYYAQGRPLAYYLTSDGHVRFQHQDWVGTERMRTTYTGSVDGTFLSLPFGDGLLTTQGSDTDPYHFAGLDQDAQNLEHATYRQLSSVTGQWMRPDPYDGSYDFSNPQSLNRYVYAGNSPVSAVDPLGLFTIGTGTDCTAQNYSVDGFTQGTDYFCGDSLSDADSIGGVLNVPSAVGGYGAGRTAPSSPKTPTCSSVNTSTNLLSRFAAFSNRGLFIGGSGGYTAPTTAGTVTIGLYADPSGSVFRVDSTAVSIGLAAGGSLSGGFTFGVSNYKNGGFAGLSGETSATAGFGPSATATFSYNANGYGTTLTLGPGAGLSGSTGISNTTLTPVCHKGVSVLGF